MRLERRLRQILTTRRECECPDGCPSLVQIDPNQPPCQAQGCAVCTICATSFDLQRAGTGPNAGAAAAAALPTAGLRYGRGLYFSKVSSKSDSYAGATERAGQGSQAHTLPRLMFLCKVALGLVHETQEESLEEGEIARLIEGKGRGGQYHSIVGGGKAEGGPLNYQETVVYAAQAAVPSYLIVYEFGHANTGSALGAQPPARRHVPSWDEASIG